VLDLLYLTKVNSLDSLACMNWESEENSRLINALLSLESVAEAQDFLRDLMTPTEISEMSKRLQASVMLMSKESYLNIEKKTGLSSTTIARVSKWLNAGKGGYKSVLNKLHHTNSPTDS